MAEDYINEVAEVADAMNAVYENKQTNKKNDISGDFSSDNNSYPTVKAVKNAYGTKKTSWASTPSDTDIPSEKLVKDSLDSKADVSSIPSKTSDLTNDGTGKTNIIFVESDDSRLTDARNPLAHTQATNTITNSKAFNHILIGESDTLTLTDLDKILTAIDNKLGILEGIEFIKITSDKGTASASTMNKLFFEVGQSNTSIYYTVENNGSYSWEKLEDDILEDIVVPSDVSDLTDNTGLLMDSSDVQSEISAFASALANAINPSP